MRKPRIYIAGPYSQGDTIRNIGQAIDAAQEIWLLGAVSYIPHLSAFWHMMYPHSYDDWLAYDYEWLSACDAIFRIPGESPGADQEEEWALGQCKPVFRSLKELCDWLKSLDRDSRSV